MLGVIGLNSPHYTLHGSRERGRDPLAKSSPNRLKRGARLCGRLVPIDSVPRSTLPSGHRFGGALRRHSHFKILSGTLDDDWDGESRPIVTQPKPDVACLTSTFQSAPWATRLRSIDLETGNSLVVLHQFCPRLSLFATQGDANRVSKGFRNARDSRSTATAHSTNKHNPHGSGSDRPAAQFSYRKQTQSHAIPCSTPSSLGVLILKTTQPPWR